MRQGYIPTIAELQAFCACARAGATTRAAQSLNLTQSAVSRSLQSLEERLGVQLFHRVRQRLVLSDAGRALQREADRLLDELNRTAQTVMSFGGRSQVLRLAVLPTFASVWLVPRLHRFHAIAPHVTLDVASRLEDVDFETEPFDAAIRRQRHPRPGAIVQELMPEVLVVVAAPHLLAPGEMLDDRRLVEMPLLQQATRPNLWLDWFRDGGMDPRAILRGARFDHFDMVIGAAAAGLGVALVPELLVQRELAAGTLVLASPRRMVGEDPYALIAPDHRQLASLEQFRAWLAAEAAAG